MMRWWRPLMILGLLAGLLACAPGPSRETGPTEKERPAARPEKAAPLDFSALTGAEIIEGPPRQIVYRPGRLYRPGAVLPLPEGLDHLEALADWLSSTTQRRWLVTVNAQGEEGVVEAQLLAEKRKELLARFFLRKGVEQGGWQWQVGTDDSATLIFELSQTP